MVPVKIGARAIGPDHPPYVIAEIGSNHNGDMVLCRDLIAAAAECGADAAKFQSWTEESLISDAEYERNVAYTDRKRHFGSLREMVHAYQFTPADHEKAMEMCADAGIHFLSSAFCPVEVDMLAQLGVPAIKIASMDVNNPRLLNSAAQTGIPVILSTGMSTLAEIANAVRILRSHGNPFSLMHCVSLYPVSTRDLNLRNIPMLHTAFGCPVGFSDHSMGVAAAIASVPLGCAILEKHFTLDRSLPGWDHWLSSEPTEMRMLCSAVREAFDALGHSVRTLTEAEVKKRDQFRRCVVLSRDMKRGEVLRSEDLEFKRPGTGIPPDAVDYLLGRKLTRDLNRDHELDWADLQ